MLYYAQILNVTTHYCNELGKLFLKLFALQSLFKHGYLFMHHITLTVLC